MDFGIFVPFHRFSESTSEAEIFDRAMEMVQFAEETGFKCVWFPEHHLVQYIMCPSPLMWCIHAAAQTKKIRVGTCIIVVPYYNPLRLAGEIGLADQLTKGRLELGIGRGAFAYEFDRFGINEKIGAAKMRESMDVVEGLIGSKDFEYHGQTISFGPSTAVPHPLQGGFPPVWVAGRSSDTHKWAIERGYNIMMTPWREPFERVKVLYNQVESVIDSIKPKKRPKIAVSRMTFVGEDEEEALQGMQDVGLNHRIFTRLFENSARIDGGFTAADPVPDEYSLETLRNNLVAGSPRTCIEKLKMYEELGIDHYIAYAAFAQDYKITKKSLRLFADKVMPHFS